MKANTTELVFILDRSGSMSGLEKDTIGGFNGMIEKQKRESGEVLLSTVLFDDKVDILYDRVDINSIKPMDESQYFVRGCTAMLDAIGKTIAHIKTVRKATPKSERPERTIFVITTDGMENASCEYNYEKVKKMIEKRQEKGWEFLFLGANIDAAAEAGRMGIKNGRAVTYKCDSVGTAKNFDAVSDVLVNMRCCAPQEMNCCVENGEWASEIAAYNDSAK